MNRTPGQYYVHPKSSSDEYKNYAICSTESEDFIALTPDTSERSQADAEFIVKACNSHEELVRACQAAIAYLADPPSEFKENRDAAIEIIKDALAKAKGEQ